MSTLDKLRQKQLRRQAAETSLEALLDDQGSGGSALPGIVDGHSGEQVACGAVAERSSSGGAANGESSAKRVQPEPPVFTTSSCPSSSQELRTCLLSFLCASAFGELPISGTGVNAALRREFTRAGHSRALLSVFRAADTIEALRGLRAELVAAQCLEALVFDESVKDDDVLVVEIEPVRMFRALLASEAGTSPSGALAKRPRQADKECEKFSVELAPMVVHEGGGQLDLMVPSGEVESVEELLKAPTAKQRQLIDAGDELRKLLAEPTARQSLVCQKFMNKSRNMAQFCALGSRSDCRKAMESQSACQKIHFKKIIKPWTDESLGDCSYLDTCRHIDKCKYVHYALDLTVEQAKYLNECGVHNRGTDTKRINELSMEGLKLPAQWIQCDLRTFPLSTFNGLISVVMADPPWDIHMELPYGTLTDDEVRNLKIGDIHEDGMIFLWVTGRAMELARDCFRIWGYRRIEEIVWVKTNQLQRIIRTGRTGHWINHSKEHCLVGIKGNPLLNKNLDCDVIVSEVRETSRKPDEIYNLIERMFPNCLKLELFGRPHNVHENWITCGNQLDGMRVCDEEIVKRYNRQFPDSNLECWRKEREAMVPISSLGCDGGDTARGGAGSGISTEDAPWIPPLSAPPPMNPPLMSSPQASCSEVWIPPSMPPDGFPKMWPPEAYPPDYRSHMFMPQPWRSDHWNGVAN